MKVEVRVFATLRKYLDNQAVIALEIAEKSTIEEVIKHLQLPAKEVTIIMVNGKRAELKEILKAGDRLALFPPIGGG